MQCIKSSDCNILYAIPRAQLSTFRAQTDQFGIYFAVDNHTVFSKCSNCGSDPLPMGNYVFLGKEGEQLVKYCTGYSDSWLDRVTCAKVRKDGFLYCGTIADRKLHGDCQVYREREDEQCIALSNEIKLVSKRVKGQQDVSRDLQGLITIAAGYSDQLGRFNLVDELIRATQVEHDSARVEILERLRISTKYDLIFDGNFEGGVPHGRCYSAFCPACSHGNLWIHGNHVIDVEKLSIFNGMPVIQSQQTIKVLVPDIEEGEKYFVEGTYDPDQLAFTDAVVSNDGGEIVAVMSFESRPSEQQPMSFPEFRQIGMATVFTPYQSIAVSLYENRTSATIQFAPQQMSLHQYTGGIRGLFTVNGLLSLPQRQKESQADYVILYKGGVKVEGICRLPWIFDVQYDGEGEWYQLKQDGTSVIKIKAVFQGDVPIGKGKIFHEDLRTQFGAVPLVQKLRGIGLDIEDLRDCEVTKSFDRQLQGVSDVYIPSQRKRLLARWESNPDSGDRQVVDFETVL